jgi:putative mRNA 3-end processing factor
MSPFSSLVTVTERGLYCPPGDFYIDPWQPVQTAVITHGHGDHLRGGSSRYIVARAGAAIARSRLNDDSGIIPTDYGETVRLGSVQISLHPAGHILGSAQVRIEHPEGVWVVSGDYKRDADPTCAPFEPVPCDVFVSEATFALPVYRWEPTAQVIADIAAWWRTNRERGFASVLFCYALGKAQRVLAELAAFASEPVYVHGALLGPIEIYRAAGVDMLPALPATVHRKVDYRGSLILAPPSASGSPWMRRFGEHATGFCSGWMRVRGERRRRGYDRGFALSDHADWPALVRTCSESGARRILLTHGYSDALTRYLNESGITAAALQTPYGAEE